MTKTTENTRENWNQLFEQMNETVTESVGMNMEAQMEFMESQAQLMESWNVMDLPDNEVLTESVTAYGRAYEVWMDAATEIFEHAATVTDREDLSVSEFRDIWLRSANEIFKEMMGTTGFAAANGDVVEIMMELQRQTEEMSEETLARVGLPTRGELDEVAERLLELERRQHSIESKLDEIIDRLE